jgi:hypothetical protein
MYSRSSDALCPEVVEVENFHALQLQLLPLLLCRLLPSPVSPASSVHAL